MSTSPTLAPADSRSQLLASNESITLSSTAAAPSGPATLEATDRESFRKGIPLAVAADIDTFQPVQHVPLRRRLETEVPAESEAHSLTTAQRAQGKIASSDALAAFLEHDVLPEVFPALRRCTSSATSHSGRLVGTLHDQHFQLQRGLYLKVEVYRGEPALDGSVMKLDKFDGIDVLPRIFDGVPNLRLVPNTRLVGCGQPDRQGVVSILRDLKTDPTVRRIVWINLREEPVNYINGRSFGPREPKTLNVNLEYLYGIEGFELDAMEKRLKADLMRASFKSDGSRSLRYFHQDETGLNQLYEEDVTHGSVATVKETMDACIAETRMPTNYHRIPITDESAPEVQDFDELIKALRDLDADRDVVLAHCHMGRGRTSTGLVIAYLVLITHRGSRHRALSITEPVDDGGSDESAPDCNTMSQVDAGGSLAAPSNRSAGSSSSVLMSPDPVAAAASASSSDGNSSVVEGTPTVAHGRVRRHQQHDDTPMPEFGSDDERMQAGYWSIIERLVEMLDDGVETKRQVDAAIDACDEMQNLRTCIWDCRRNMLSAEADASSREPGNANDRGPKFWRHRGVHYLERYWWVILFNAYARRHVADHYRVTFAEFLKGKWGLRRSLRHIELQ